MSQEDTRETFDAIAPAWYGFRHRTIFRPELEALAIRWKSGRLLNIGCAHGPDFLPFIKSFELHGIDFSPAMLENARRYAEKYNFSVSLVEADARSLPFADATFDFAIAVAVYHHIDTAAGRSQALKELYRVLQPGGEAFVTVWNKWQPRFWFTRKGTQVPWHSGGKTLYRYYYLYSFSELEKAVRLAGLEILKSSPESSYKFPLKLFSRNICLLLQKPSG
jgi:tRNA (uracil-5-)-methyltransferase TRM9